MKNSTVNYGKIIAAARNSRGMTQLQLGEKVNLGKTAICNYETNYSTPSVDVFDKIAEALGYSIIEMLCFDESLGQASTLQFPRAMQPASDAYIPYLTLKSLKEKLYDTENYMDYYLTIPGFMVSDSKASYLCTKMPDNSMDNDGIRKNDYIIVKRCSFVPDKCIVLSSRLSDGEIFVRRYFRDNHTIAFIPSSLSEEYSIIRTDERSGEYKIIGFVEKILTNLR